VCAPLARAGVIDSRALEQQQAILLELLRKAAGVPVSYAELQDGDAAWASRSSDSHRISPDKRDQREGRIANRLERLKRWAENDCLPMNIAKPASEASLS
jgi:hypothetical protein